jgi:hypothetical protein
LKNIDQNEIVTLTFKTFLCGIIIVCFYLQRFVHRVQFHIVITPQITSNGAIIQTIVHRSTNVRRLIVNTLEYRYDIVVHRKVCAKFYLILLNSSIPKSICNISHLSIKVHHVILFSVSICLQSPSPGYGECNNNNNIAEPIHQTMYYFDALRLHCTAFQYVGCNGINENQFATLVECQNYCEATGNKY